MNGLRYIKIHYTLFKTIKLWKHLTAKASGKQALVHSSLSSPGLDQRPRRRRTALQTMTRELIAKTEKSSTEIGIDLVFSQATSVPNFSKAWEEEETSLSSLVVSCEGRPPNSSLIRVIPESLCDKTLQNNGFTFSCHCGSGSLVELRSKSIGAHLVFAPTRACLWLQSTKPLNEAPQTCQVSLKVLL